jgi:hypothetical protein
MSKARKSEDPLLEEILAAAAHRREAFDRRPAGWPFDVDKDDWVGKILDLVGDILAALTICIEVRLGASLQSQQADKGYVAKQRGVELLAKLILYGFAFDLIVCLFWARPLAPFLLGAALLWWSASCYQNFVATTARDFSIPLALGLTLICLALLGLNSFNAVADPQQVHTGEVWLARGRLRFEEWTHLSLTRVLILGTALLALAAIVPNLRPVTHFKRAKAIVAFGKILILVLTSFTIYAQSPLQKEVGQIHAEIVHRYRASLKKEWNADARTVAAHTLSRHLDSMTAPEWFHLAKQLRSVDRAARASLLPGDARSVDRQIFAEARPSEFSVAPQPPRPLDGQAQVETMNLIGQSPTTNHDLDRQEQAAVFREASAKRSQYRGAESEKAATLFVDTLVEFFAPTPHASNIATGFADAFIGGARERVVSLIVRRFISKESSDTVELDRQDIRSVIQSSGTKGQAATIIRDTISRAVSWTRPSPPLPPKYLQEGIKEGMRTERLRDIKPKLGLWGFLEHGRIFEHVRFFK